MVESISYYFIGLWLGDGFLSLNMGKYWKFGIVCSEFNYDEIREVVKPTRQKEYRTKDGKYKYYELFTGNKELIEFLRENYGTNSKDKHIPGDLSSDDFWELFSGLIDSDGTLDKDSVLFMNSNRGLVDSVAEYLKSFGVEHSVSVRKAVKEKWSDVYVLRLRAGTLSKTNLHLRVDYKRDAYDTLKKRSHSYVLISDEEFDTNREYLKRVLPKSTFYFFSKGLRPKKVTEDIFNNMVVNR